MTTKKEKSTNLPAFIIYASIPDGRQNRIGSKIGVAFNHKNGEGMTIILDALPIPVDGQAQLVAYPYEPKS